MLKAISDNGIYKKVRDFFILDPEEGEFEEPQQEERFVHDSKVIPFQDRARRSSVSIADPQSAEEAKKAADDLKAGMIVLVNITMMEKDMAREFLNFLSGAAYALNGNYKKVGSGVFLFTPNSVPIQELEDLVDQTQKEETLLFKDI